MSASARLARLAAQIEEALGDSVNVERSNPIERTSLVKITPARDDALGVGWFEGLEQVIAWTDGGLGGRWELSTTEADLDLLEAIIQSVIAGRVSEVLGPGRSRVKVTLSDGRTLSETGHSAPGGCVPLPFWTKWGRKVRYAPYRKDLAG